MENKQHPFVSSNYFPLLLILLVSYFSYSSVFEHGFIKYDDYNMIVKRADKYDGLNRENISDIILNDFPREEPLIARDLSYLVNAQFFGTLNPFGYLFGNFILYAFTGYLVYLLTLLITNNNLAIAMMASVLFVLHPVHVESVAWVSSRKDMLYVVFYLSGLLIYLRYLDSRKKYLLAIIILLSLLSLMSKIAAISFIPILLLSRYCFYQKRKVNINEKAFFIISVFVSAVYVKWYHSILSVYGVFDSQVGKVHGISNWILTNIEILSFYIAKLILPINLAAIYDFPRPAGVFTNISYLFYSIFVFIALIILLKRFFCRKNQLLFFLLCWFILALSPYMSMAHVGFSVADRYVYLASVAFSIAGAMFFYTFFQFVKWLDIKWLKYLPHISLITYCTLLFWGTTSTITLWGNDLLFWENIRKVSPEAKNCYPTIMSIHVNNYLSDKGNPVFLKKLMEEEALQEKALVRIASKKSSSHSLAIISNSLAFASYFQGKVKTSEKYHTQSIVFAPENIEYRVDFISFLIEQKRYAEAILEIEKAEKLPKLPRNRQWFHKIDTQLLPLAIDGLK